MRFRFVCVATALLTASFANAHHSVTAYDLTKTKEISGTVREFQWTNPHSWIQVMVIDENGNEVEWSVECGAPSINSRLGWKKSDLRPGDKVTVQVHPMRDGTTHGTLKNITLVDGRTLQGPTERIGTAGQSTPGSTK